MSQRFMVLRVVPKGLPAAGWNDEDECDLDAPCDLVALERTEVGEDVEEQELDRKSFSTGHEASKHMASMLRR